MRRFFRSLVELISWRLATATLLLLSISFGEGVSLLLLVPLLGLIGLPVEQGGTGAVATVLERLLSVLGVTPTLPLVLGIYLVVFILVAFLDRRQTIVIQAIEESFSRALRQRLYRAITASSWRFFVNRQATTFHHALTSELNRVRSVTRSALVLLVQIVVALVYIGFALYLSVPITLLAFLCGAGLALLLRPLTLSARRKGQAISQANRGLHAAAGEHLAGMRVAKSHGTEQAHLQAFARLALEVEEAYVDAARNQADVQFWFQAGAVVSLSLLVLVAFQFLALQVATVVLLLFLFSRLLPMFTSVQSLYQSLIGSLPAFDEVMGLVAACEAAAEAPEGEGSELELRRSLELRGVSFRYGEEGPDVLEGLDLIVEAGRTTALVGLSGAGKSTVSDLLAGLITPDRGTVLVDGEPLEAGRVHAWRRRLGYVAQETFLFHDTIRANLLVTRPDATEQELFAALEQASAAAFVRRLPQGLDTVVGDRGVRLSGGERQRLALARALLRRPALLLLDEATSSLDAENEKNVQRAIERLKGHMTMVIVTHRLATVRQADVIHLVEDGRVTETGSWDQLIRQPGRFRALCEAQGLRDAPVP